MITMPNNAGLLVNTCTRTPDPLGHLHGSYFLFLLFIICISLHINMDKAIAYRRQHPKESFSKVQISLASLPQPSTTESLPHMPPGVSAPAETSIAQEAAILDKIITCPEGNPPHRPACYRTGCSRRISRRSKEQEKPTADTHGMCYNTNGAPMR